MKRHLGCLLALVLTISACGDDGGKADKDTDQKHADAAVLTSDDVSNDFAEASDASDANDDDVYDCIDGIGAEEAHAAETAKAKRNFEADAGLPSIEATVTYYESAEVPTKLTEALTDDKVVDCVAGEAMESVEEDPEPGVTVNGVQVGADPEVPELGDQRVARALDFELEADGDAFEFTAACTPYGSAGPWSHSNCRGSRARSTTTSRPMR